MPVPLTTTLLIAAIAVALLGGTGAAIAVAVLCTLAVANEAVLTIVGGASDDEQR